jgi:hypothetical protein
LQPALWTFYCLTVIVHLDLHAPFFSACNGKNYTSVSLNYKCTDMWEQQYWKSQRINSSVLVAIHIPWWSRVAKLVVKVTVVVEWYK